MNEILAEQLAIALIVVMIVGPSVIMSRYKLTPFQRAAVMFLCLALGGGGTMSLIVISTRGDFKQLVVIAVVMLPLALVGSLGNWFVEAWGGRRFRR